MNIKEELEHQIQFNEDMAISYAKTAAELKEKLKNINRITDITPGDLFRSPSQELVVIIEQNCGSCIHYGFTGLDNNPFSLYTNQFISKDKMVEFLNSKGYNFIRNINYSLTKMFI